MATSDREWIRVWQRMKTNENKQNSVSDLRFQIETKDQAGSWRILFNVFCNM